MILFFACNVFNLTYLRLGEDLTGNANSFYFTLALLSVPYSILQAAMMVAAVFLVEFPLSLVKEMAHSRLEMGTNELLESALQFHSEFKVRVRNGSARW